jgi:hypothetical protein
MAKTGLQLSDILRQNQMARFWITSDISWLILKAKEKGVIIQKFKPWSKINAKRKKNMKERDIQI